MQVVLGNPDARRCLGAQRVPVSKRQPHTWHLCWENPSAKSLVRGLPAAGTGQGWLEEAQKRLCVLRGTGTGGAAGQGSAHPRKDWLSLQDADGTPAQQTGNHKTPDTWQQQDRLEGATCLV